MHPEDIKAAIRKRGIKPADIARQLDVSDMSVSAVIAGNGKSARIAERISQVTGLSVDTLWPGKYLTVVREPTVTRRRALATMGKAA